MNILVLGGGGREHALCWKLKKSPLCQELYCMPGNAGIADVATVLNGDACDSTVVLQACRQHHIDLVVIGPEAPLVAGVSDTLRAAHILVFGPSQAAAQLEASKGFVKDLCQRYHIPTARYQRFTKVVPALMFAQTLGLPVVIKADGLAAGKGVVIATNMAEVEQTLKDMLEDHAFGEAGAEVVVEEFLHGEEVSFFALTDGHTVIPLATAQDHKRAFDGDTGPNTGGMGAYSPALQETPAFVAEVMRTIIEPTLRGLMEDGIIYQGVLYAGLMLTTSGVQLLEYNARFGDPECEALMLRLDSDLLALLLAVAEGDLASVQPVWSPDPALCVVMASQGYPGTFEKGTVIRTLPSNAPAGTVIFHAGTSRNAQGNLIASGGRVLVATAKGKTLRAAQQAAYAALSDVHWPQGFYRRDIGWRGLSPSPQPSP